MNDQNNNATATGENVADFINLYGTADAFTYDAAAEKTATDGVKRHGGGAGAGASTLLDDPNNHGYYSVRRADGTVREHRLHLRAGASGFRSGRAVPNGDGKTLTVYIRTAVRDKNVWYFIHADNNDLTIPATSGAGLRLATADRWNFSGFQLDAENGVLMFTASPVADDKKTKKQKH